MSPTSRRIVQVVALAGFAALVSRLVRPQTVWEPSWRPAESYDPSAGVASDGAGT